MEKSIPIKDGIGIKELRALFELQVMNKALNQDEFQQILSIYNQAIERLLKQEE